jgi:large subunit ribosomal protein L31e
MADNKEQKIYTISLRDAYRSPRIYRARKAINYLHDYLRRHLKAEVIIGPGLNQKIWARGIKKPPKRVKVTVRREEDKFRVELFGYKPKPKKEKKPAKKKKGLGRVAKEKIEKKKAKPKEKPKKGERGKKKPEKEKKETPKGIGAKEPEPKEPEPEKKTEEKKGEE